MKKTSSIILGFTSILMLLILVTSCESSDVDSSTNSNHIHHFSEEWTIDQEATCREAGSKSHHCSDCDEKADITSIPATGHSFADWTTTTEPTETTLGIKERQCSVCHYKETEILPILIHTHNYSEEWTTDVEPTCREAGSKSYHCLTCGSKKDITSIPANGHTFGDWTTTTEPTETTLGIKEKECSVCHYKETETLPALTHTHNYSEEWTVDVEPTCRETGSKSHHCLTCGSKKDITSISANGHTFGEWTTTTEPTETTLGTKERECSSCHYKETETISVLPHTHSYSEEWTVDVEPTCREAGSKSHHCLTCGSKKDITVLGALGHNYVNGVCTKCGQNLETSVLIFELDSKGNSYYVKGVGNNVETDIVIPSTYNGKPVTGIGNYAFYDCVALSRITIPESITSIGKSAFENCRSLTSVIIPESITSIEISAFENCSSLTSITLPFVGSSLNGAENTHFGYIFGAGSCSDNLNYVPSSLKEVIITGGETIGDSAFRECSSLASITIPNSVTSIGKNAFRYCYKLVEIYNLSSLSIIKGNSSNGYVGYYAKVIHTSLEEESNLITKDNYVFIIDKENKYYLVGYNGTATDLVLPNDIEGNAYEINSGAFYKSSLTSITIPNSVTSIGNSAFYGCSSLINVYYDGTIGDWYNINIKSGNSDLTAVNHYYYSETKPTDTANMYWHYDENKNICIW